jgi:hypothetical protein
MVGSLRVVVLSATHRSGGCSKEKFDKRGYGSHDQASCYSHLPQSIAFTAAGSNVHAKDEEVLSQIGHPVYIGSLMTNMLAGVSPPLPIIFWCCRYSADHRSPRTGPISTASFISLDSISVSSHSEAAMLRRSVESLQQPDAASKGKQLND